MFKKIFRKKKISNDDGDQRWRLRSTMAIAINDGDCDQRWRLRSTMAIAINDGDDDDDDDQHRNGNQRWR